MLRGLGSKLKAAPVGSDERQETLDKLLREFTIHMKIEDDIYYPALAAASRLIAIAHAEHRQIYDQLAVALRTPTSSPRYVDEWNSFLTVLEAHADEEERDLVPPCGAGRPDRRGVGGPGQSDGRGDGTSAQFQVRTAARESASETAGPAARLRLRTRVRGARRTSLGRLGYIY